MHNRISFQVLFLLWVKFPYLVVLNLLLDPLTDAEMILEAIGDKGRAMIKKKTGSSAALAKRLQEHMGSTESGEFNRSLQSKVTLALDD